MSGASTATASSGSVSSIGHTSTNFKSFYLEKQTIIDPKDHLLMSLLGLTPGVEARLWYGLTSSDKTEIETWQTR